MKVNTDSDLDDKEKQDDKKEKKIDNADQKKGGVSMDNKKERNRDGGQGKDAEHAHEVSDLTDKVMNLKISADNNMRERGPTGGIPIQSKVSNIANKVVLMAPLSNCVDTQYYGEMQRHVPQKKGARSHDDEEDLPAHKYFNPGSMNITFAQSHGGYIDNLGQTKPAMMNPDLLHEYQFGMDQVEQSMATSQMTITGPMSGGEVTGMSAVSNAQPIFCTSFFDDFLDEITAENVPNPETLPEEHGPCLETSPSPSLSTNTSPYSVDSGCERSPIYESTALPGASSSKYDCLTSPANTSGYGSPETPLVEDSRDFLDPNRLDELELAYEVIDILKKDDEYKQSEKEGKATDTKALPVQTIVSPPTIPGNAGTTTRVQPVNRSHVMQNQKNAASCISVRKAPDATLTPTANSAGDLALTTSSAPPKVIILPQVIVLQQGPSNTQPNKNPPRQQLRKILPKEPQTSSSIANTSCNISITNTTPSIKSEVSKTSSMTILSSKRNGRTEPAYSAQDKLLSMARKSVAAADLEYLTKCDKDGDTSLHIAVCKSDKEMVLALLERLKKEELGHLVDQENNKRQTPLYLAVYTNQPVMVHMLIRFNADVNVPAQAMLRDRKSVEKKAAIHVAASRGSDYLKTLEILVSAKNISMNIVNSYGQTALHCAILAHGKLDRHIKEKINSVSIIKALIKAGADPSAQDKKSGKTPLMYAIEQRNLGLVEAILTSVEPGKVRNVVKTQAFDGSSCLRIAEGLRTSYQAQAWKKLWNRLNSATSESPN